MNAEQTVRWNKMAVRVTELEKENERLKQQLATANADWARDDTAVRDLAKSVLPAADVDGDEHGVPTITDIVETLCKQLAAAQRQ